jgi:hypothetical protein
MEIQEVEKDDVRNVKKRTSVLTVDVKTIVENVVDLRSVNTTSEEVFVR